MIGAPIGIDSPVGLVPVHGTVVNRAPLRDDAGNHPKPRKGALIQRMARHATHHKRVDLIRAAI